MIKYCHELEAPSAVQAGSGIHVIEGIGIGIPESHDVKAPPVLSDGPVYKSIKIIVAEIVEEHGAQVVYDVDGVGS